MRNLTKELKDLSGGLVYQSHSDVFVLAPNDSLELPSFTISYPDVGAPSNAYVLNGSPVLCTGEQNDNSWLVPSKISNSFFSKDSVTIQTDGFFLYVQATYCAPYGV